MTEIADRYRRLVAAFGEKLEQVPADAWSLPTPCADWTVRDLVGHVVQTQGMFLGFIGRQAGDIPDVADDPIGAFAQATAAVQRHLDDPEHAQSEFDGFFGRTTFEAAV